LNNRIITHKSVSISEIVSEFQLEVIYDGNLDYQMTAPNINRSGSELTGFFDKNSEILDSYIQIFGKEEMTYLKKLDVDKRVEILNKYFSYSFPGIILCDTDIIEDEFLRIAGENNKSLFKTKESTSVFIRDMKYFLQKKLAPEMMLNDHILLEIFGIGILITGDEDTKQGVAIELIERGHKFITDDNVILKRTGDDHLIGENRFDKSSPDEHFFLVHKGGGKIDLTDAFGLGSTRKEKQINLLVNLERWDVKKFYDRLGLDQVFEDFLGIKIQKLTLPVRKGRNLAVILETAAINHRLKKSGVNSAEYFLNETKKLILENKKKNQGEEGMKNHISLSVNDLKKTFNLEVLCGEDKLDSAYIYKTSIHRPALALSGYYDMIEEDGPDRLQVFSEGEFRYLESLDEETRNKNLETYLNYDFPAIILSKIDDLPEYFIDAVKKKGRILLRSNKSKTSQIIADFNSFLETYFAPSITLHGVFVEMYGFGVLLTGKSGIGKSETALELIHRGHRLIADDMVKFIKHPSGDIIGRAAKLPHFMEIRGLGIIDIKALYGLGSVRLTKRLDAILELKELKSDEYLTSTKYSGGNIELLERSVHKAELYISSGRNAAAMVEVATMNLMAKKLGHDPEKAYKESFSRFTEEEKRILDFQEN
jgi:HPr kinase/phosphorylase